MLSTYITLPQLEYTLWIGVYAYCIKGLMNINQGVYMVFILYIAVFFCVIIKSGMLRLHNNFYNILQTTWDNMERAAWIQIPQDVY